MEEHETMEKIKSKQGIFSKIQNFFTLGYGTKEDLRELDKKLRDFYYIDLRDIRHIWEDVYLKVLDTGIEVSSRDLKKILQKLDIIMEKVHHADYGYAGLMDRKGHIRENELVRVFDYDRTLSDSIERLKEAIEKSQKDVEDEKWTDIPNAVKKVKDLLSTLEDRWSERKGQFRPLE